MSEKQWEMREDSFDSDHRICPSCLDPRPFVLMVKVWIIIRSYMLRKHLSMSNKNSKIHMLQSHLSFFRCVVQFIKKGQISVKGEVLLPKLRVDIRENESKRENALLTIEESKKLLWGFKEPKSWAETLFSLEYCNSILLYITIQRIEKNIRVCPRKWFITVINLERETKRGKHYLRNLSLWKQHWEKLPISESPYINAENMWYYF